jgi:hypothetical protein
VWGLVTTILKQRVASISGFRLLYLKEFTIPLNFSTINIMTAQAPATDVRASLEAAGAHYMNLIEFGILKVFIDHQVFDHIPEQSDDSIESWRQRPTETSHSSNASLTTWLRPKNLANTTHSLSPVSEQRNCYRFRVACIPLLPAPHGLMDCLL